MIPRNYARPCAAAALLGFLFCLALPGQAAQTFDLSRAVVVLAADAPGPEQKAAQMLVEEVTRRTQLRWMRTNGVPGATPVILLGTVAELRQLPGAPELELPATVGQDRPEGYSIWSTGPESSPRVIVAGRDTRGVLFGVGRLLRELAMTRQKVVLAADFKIESAPRMPLRGHQLGFRPKTNSYDGWDVPTWEQYFETS